MRIGVSGSRHLSLYQQHEADKILRGILSAYGHDDELHHGNAMGIDTIAARVAKAYGLKVVCHPPKVNQWGGPGGYKERNMDIVKSVNLLIAIHSPDSLTGGTLWTYNYAEKNGIRTEWIELPR